MSQPEIRPIMRGKSKSPIEFVPKINVSIMDVVIDIEQFSFNAFNESGDLGSTLDHYYDVHPDEVLLGHTVSNSRKHRDVCQPWYSVSVDRGLDVSQGMWIQRSAGKIKTQRTVAAKLNADSRS